METTKRECYDIPVANNNNNNNDENMYDTNRLQKMGFHSTNYVRLCLDSLVSISNSKGIQSAHIPIPIRNSPFCYCCTAHTKKNRQNRQPHNFTIFVVRFSYRFHDNFITFMENIYIFSQNA